MSYLQGMDDAPVQLLEVRAAEPGWTVTITLAISGSAGQAIATALSEQLDRHRTASTDTAEGVIRLRERSALTERFAPLAAAAGHAVLSLSAAELQVCLLELTAYSDRIDDATFQPPEVRERLALIAGTIPVLWDANAAAAAAAAPLTESAPLP